MRDILTEIWTTASRNKLRTALTGFAVAWGIFMLIFLLGAGNGLIHAVMQNSGRFLANSMMIGSGSTSKPYDGLKEGRIIRLDDDDIAETREQFGRNVESVGAEITQGSVTLTLGDNYVDGNLMGVYPNEADINKREMLQGRFINDRDVGENRKNIVISETQAKELMPRDMSQLIGKDVKMDALVYRVVGIYKKDDSWMNNNVYCAFTTVRTIYGKGNKADNIVFSFRGLETEDDNQAFEKDYRARINTNHRAAPDDEQAVWIWNRFTQNMQMQTGLGMIRIALWVIGIFTLLSGIVGVSNIMLIAVKERTREFGIRKAIGATPASILRLVIIESVIITTIFGYIGMVCGVAANFYMDATVGREKVNTGLFQVTLFVDPTVGLDVCVRATLLMVVAGTVAGAIPARKASKIKPIEALRAE